MKPALLVAVLALAAAGCDTAEPQLTDAPLLALTTGNSWTYTKTYDDGRTTEYTLRVGAPREIGGETYYVLEQDFGTSVARSTFARITPDGLVLAYASEADNLFRYPADDGSAYDYADPDDGSVTSYTVGRATVETPAGRFATVTYGGYDADPEIEAAFSPGVGLVRLTESGARTDLVDYRLADTVAP